MLHSAKQNRKMYLNFRQTSSVYGLFVVSPPPGLHVLSLSADMDERESAGKPDRGESAHKTPLKFKVRLYNVQYSQNIVGFYLPLLTDLSS